MHVETPTTGGIEHIDRYRRMGDDRNQKRFADIINNLFEIGYKYISKYNLKYEFHNLFVNTEKNKFWEKTKKALKETPSEKDAKAKLPNPKLGHVSASCWSVEYNNPFSLAILKDGKNMIGQKLFAMSPLKNKTIPVEIVSSHYVDPKGERVRS